MKNCALLFLLIYIPNAYSATLINFGAALCGYGQYNYNGTCTDLDTNHNSCKDLFSNHSGHLISIPISTFRFLESGDIPCYGMYDFLRYNSDILRLINSGGDFSTTNGMICGYGKYHLNGECYSYSEETAIGACKTNYHLIGTHDASFMGLQRSEPYCLGDYYLYNYPELIHPIYNGTLLTFGSPIGVVIDMKTDSCSVNSNRYYKIGITGTDSYAYPNRGICDSGYSKFIVRDNCWHIDTNDAAALKKAHVCGVLCDSGDYVYTNSGRCSTDGYCENGAKKLRLHVARPDGEKYSYPLYASKTSDPAMHFKFVNASGNEQMCYVNLVPPEAINHFVGTKPNPIRTMFYNPTTGKNETLITID